MVAPLQCKRECQRLAGKKKKKAAASWNEAPMRRLPPDRKMKAAESAFQCRAKEKKCSVSPPLPPKKNNPRAEKALRENKNASQDFLGILIVRVWIGAASRWVVGREGGVKQPDYGGFGCSQGLFYCFSINISFENDCFLFKKKCRGLSCSCAFT